MTDLVPKHTNALVKLGDGVEFHGLDLAEEVAAICCLRSVALESAPIIRMKVETSWPLGYEATSEVVQSGDTFEIHLSAGVWSSSSAILMCLLVDLVCISRKLGVDTGLATNRLGSHACIAARERWGAELMRLEVDLYDDATSIKQLGARVLGDLVDDIPEWQIKLEDTAEAVVMWLAKALKL